MALLGALRACEVPGSAGPWDPSKADKSEPEEEGSAHVAGMCEESRAICLKKKSGSHNSCICDMTPAASTQAKIGTVSFFQYLGAWRTKRKRLL